ncbi:MAG: hypothetical protein IJ191_06235 [Treponema sp.]|nr:hypothetical protein [Treponema sp.]
MTRDELRTRTIHSLPTLYQFKASPASTTDHHQTLRLTTGLACKAIRSKIEPADTRGAIPVIHPLPTATDSTTKLYNLNANIGKLYGYTRGNILCLPLYRERAHQMHANYTRWEKSLFLHRCKHFFARSIKKRDVLYTLFKK